MLVPDYSAPAELYATPGRGARRAMFYRKFPTLAEAVRFAVEDLPSGMMHAIAETEHDRFEDVSLRALYDAEQYPLPRVAARRMPKKAAA